MELIRNSEHQPFICKECAFAGDVLSGKEALLAGDGISVDLSISSLLNELKNGLLQVVLPGWHRPSWNMSAAIRKEDAVNTRLTAFVRWFGKHERAALAKRKMEQAPLVGLAPFTF